MLEISITGPLCVPSPAASQTTRGPRFQHRAFVLLFLAALRSAAAVDQPHSAARGQRHPAAGQPPAHVPAAGRAAEAAAAERLERRVLLNKCFGENKERDLRVKFDIDSRRRKEERSKSCETLENAVISKEKKPNINISQASETVRLRGRKNIFCLRLKR